MKNKIHNHQKKKEETKKLLAVLEAGKSKIKTSKFSV